MTTICSRHENVDFIPMIQLTHHVLQIVGILLLLEAPCLPAATNRFRQEPQDQVNMFYVRNYYLIKKMIKNRLTYRQ